MSEKEVLTTEEAAEFLGIDPQTLQRWMREKDVPVIKIGPRYTRFLRSSLLEWLKRQERPATSGEAVTGADEPE